MDDVWPPPGKICQIEQYLGQKSNGTYVNKVREFNYEITLDLRGHWRLFGD